MQVFTVPSLYFINIFVLIILRSTIHLEDFGINQHRLNVLRNLPQEIGS